MSVGEGLIGKYGLGVERPRVIQKDLTRDKLRPQRDGLTGHSSADQTLGAITV